MSVEIACECGGLPPHSHVYRWETLPNGWGGSITERRDTGEVRVWVDWKAVAHELAVGTA